MSTNVKNVIRPEYLKNYTTKIKRRYIIIENADKSMIDFQKIVNNINSQTNQIIQSINLKVKDRQIPYITLIAQFTSELTARSRIVVCNQNTSEDFEERIKNQSNKLGISLSHCINLLVAPGYKEIIISSLDYDAEIVVAKEFVECAIIDILLDIAMFNSYSFLKNNSLVSKHNFSYEKFDYFNKNNLRCYYKYKSNKDLYYSLAFSARNSLVDFDINHYIDLWNGFIKTNYSMHQHKEKSIAEQLKQHIDYCELPANLSQNINELPDGSYLIMRTNKDRTESLNPFLCSVFGISEYEKGKITIVPIEDFDKYKPLFENLDVSVFKIVKSTYNSQTEIEKKQHTEKKKKNNSDIKSHHGKRFKIALTFPGEYRDLVDNVAQKLVNIYGKECVLYDNNFRSEFARPNLDVYLQKLYSEESELIVVFFCKEYNEKNWCGIEWRSIRKLLNSKSDEQIMLIKCGDGSVSGLFDSVDGYIDASTTPTETLVEYITERYDKLK